jgi:hypothetical protein
MKILPTIFFSLTLLATTMADITIDDVVSNNDQKGEILLKQGYKGQLRIIDGDELANDNFKKVFEFTHAILNDNEPPFEAPRAQAICVGIDAGAISTSYRFKTLFSKNLPDLDLVCASKTLEDLIKLLGKPRTTSPGLANDGTRIESAGWNLFTVKEDRSLDVISVFVIMKLQKDQWIITDRRVAQGIFKATGDNPKLEREAEQAAPRNH